MEVLAREDIWPAFKQLNISDVWPQIFLLATHRVQEELSF